MTVVKLLPDADDPQMGTVADNDHNNNHRDGQGPPVGSVAWTCRCGCFSFYITASDIRCYECHAEQSF